MEGNMGSKKNVDMTQTEDVVKKIEIKETVLEKETESKKTDSKKTPVKTAAKKEVLKETDQEKKVEKIEQKVIKKAKTKKIRGKKYQAVRAQLDKTKVFSPKEAIALVKKLSYVKFDASIEAHIMVKEIGTSVELQLPHKTGKSVRAVIADDEILANVEKGEINFDVLLATPEMMPKLAKLAKILGPKGLMPNPKNGTLTPKPELKKTELEAGAFTLKTEKKAPLMHLVIAKVSMDDKLIEENLITLIKALKNRVVKIAIAPSMGPAVKVNCELEDTK